jgi:hypothetical protein
MAILSADLSKATVNVPAAVEAVTFYTDMYLTHRVSPPSTLQDDWLAGRRLFIAESVAMDQSGQFDLTDPPRESPHRSRRHDAPAPPGKPDGGGAGRLVLPLLGCERLARLDHCDRTFFFIYKPTSLRSIFSSRSLEAARSRRGGLARSASA